MHLFGSIETTDRPGSGPIVGRENELAQLEALLELVAAKASATVQLVGEPGVGKTSIAQLLRASAVAKDFLVLEGRAAEFEQDIPFGLWIDALDPHLETLEPYDFARLGDDQVSELARAFPSLRSAGIDIPDGGYVDRVKFHRTIDELLVFLARKQPLMIVLDDVHWADPSSADLIAHLMKRSAKASVLLVFIYRPNQISDRLRSTFGGEAAHGRSNVIEVPPLGARHAAKIVDLSPEDDAFLDLYHESGGNPFYLEQLARVGSLPRGAVPVASGEQDVPASVSLAVMRELDQLSEQDRLTLNASSVVGETFDPELVCAAAGSDIESTSAALDRLAELDLIRPADVPRNFRFRHPIVRRAVYEATGAAWRGDVHARLVESLKERGASVAELAHHVERAGRVGDMEAVELLATAGHTVAPRAPAAAASWFAAALRLLPEGSEHNERRLQLLAARAISLGVAGQLREGGETLRTVLELLPPEMNELRLNAVLYAAVFQMLRSRHEEATQMLLAALEQLDDDHSRAAVELTAELGGAALYACDPQATRDWSLKALDLMGGEEDYLSAGIAALAAYGSVFAGEFDETRRLVDLACSTMDKLPDQEIARRVEGPLLLGGALLFLDDYRGAIRYIDWSNSVASSAGQAHHQMLGLAAKGWALMRMGRIDEARDCIDEAAEAAALAGNPAALVAAYSGRCMVEMADGTREAALEACDQAEAVMASDPGPYDDLLHQAMAFALFDAGQPQRAYDLVRRIGTKPYGTRIAPLECDRLLILTRAALQLGEVEEAEAAVIEAERLAELSQIKAWHSSAMQARCELLISKGEFQEAAKLALEAREHARDVEAVFAAISAQVTAARAYAAADDKQRAIDLLKATESELTSLGATRYRDQIAAVLRELGTSASRPRLKKVNNAGLAELSPREAQIAEMLPAGKSNREIAEELVLSVRTVERHVAHILSKLGVSSRTAVAAIVERGRGLA